MTFYVLAFGWFFNSLLLLAGPGVGELGQLRGNGWLAMGFLGVVCSGLAYIFWYDALQVIPAAELGAFLYVEPLVAVGVAAVLLGETMTVLALACGAVILLGVWLVNRVLLRLASCASWKVRPDSCINRRTRSRAITATAPASSAIFACSALVTSMMTPPLSIWANWMFNSYLSLSTFSKPPCSFTLWLKCMTN